MTTQAQAAKQIAEIERQINGGADGGILDTNTLRGLLFHAKRGLALTAAAQVGEQEQDAQAIAVIEPVIKVAIENAITATIERCAQVADSAFGNEECDEAQWAGKEIAAAIRKLKEAP